MSRVKYFLTVLMVLAVSAAFAQQPSKEQLIALTAEWQGERFEDGRPKVPDDIIERMKLVTLEEAWATIKGANFRWAYDGNWNITDPEGVLTGRAVTATFIPGRPDVHGAIQKMGREAGFRGGQNSWPVDKLVPGDVYVADQHGATVDGPTVGDIVGNTIFANSKNGFIYDGAVRDINGLKQLDNFTVYYRDYHPSHHNPPNDRFGWMLVGLNTPCRIGEATVMPGDVVLARDGGVIFIPPHLAERVVVESEKTRLRDIFGKTRLQEQKYTAGQIDGAWAPEIKADFLKWVEANKAKLPVPQKQIEKYLADGSL